MLKSEGKYNDTGGKYSIDRHSGRILFVLAGMLGTLGVVRTGEKVFSQEQTSPVAEVSADGRSPKLEAAAQAILGRQIVVICEDPDAFANDGILASYQIPDTASEISEFIQMERALCDDIARNSDESFTPNEETVQNGVFATFTFAHELAHAEGEYDEGLANCNAYPLFPQVVSALNIHFPAPYAEPSAISEVVAQRPLLPEYHSAGC